jgi:hypothetical protein
VPGKGGRDQNPGLRAPCRTGIVSGAGILYQTGPKIFPQTKRRDENDRIFSKEEFCMKETTTQKDNENEGEILNENEILVGGVELLARSPRYPRRAGVAIEYRPIAPAENSVVSAGDMGRCLAVICRTIIAVDERTRKKVRRLIARDGGTDRILYRLAVSLRRANDKAECIVRNSVDPEFLRFDPGFIEESNKIRQTIRHMLQGRPQ